ncbi:hypothetical protein DFJ77DRAFT_440643 [Powellomyces hirtus]|nr:hypothetical protein DFJ77DRAFT_440643 [Powellomyces hirtus]
MAIGFFAKLFFAGLLGSMAVSAAPPQDSKCVNAGGRCQQDTGACEGGYVTNFCPSSGDSIRCWCIDDFSIPKQDSKCTSAGGKCSFTANPCSTGYLNDYCPNSSNAVKCCKPSGGGGSGSPCGVPKTRQGLVDAAMWAHNSGQRADYTQGASRWSGITDNKCPKKNIPPHMDCSSFVTWIYWSAFGKGADLLNGESWKGGYTGTLKDHGTAVSQSNAKIGDLVFYENPAHVTILVSKSPAKVVSFGSEGPVNYLNINYRPVSQIRTYKFAAQVTPESLDYLDPALAGEDGNS